MTIDLRPVNGGFQRQIRTADFILRHLKGEGPEESQKIDPKIGAPMVDIHSAYKEVLRRILATDQVEKEEERLIKKGLPAFTIEQYNSRLEHYLNRVPLKFYRMRYSSFCRYFGHLKRLGWVKESGQTEPSSVQDNYALAPSRVFYVITAKGRKATAEETSDPLQALYHYPRRQRSAKRYQYYKVINSTSCPKFSITALHICTNWVNLTLSIPWLLSFISLS